MDTIESGNRITLKRKRPNPIFQNWLEELHEEAKQKKSKLENMLETALASLSKYPLPLQTGAECAILNGFDKRLCLFLDKRLEVYNRSRNQLPLSTCSENNFIYDPNQPSTSKNSIGFSSPESPKATSKVYKPSYRSGGYAILIALFEHTKTNKRKSLNKDTIIEYAQKYCDDSFTVPSPDSFYTAWSNMQRLITKGLVKESNHNNEYSLTENGFVLANDLLKNSLETSTANDIIFTVESSSLNQLSYKEANNIEENVIQLDKNGIESANTSISSNIPETNNLQNANGLQMDPGSFDIILLIDKNETGGLTKKNDPTVVEFKKYPNLLHEYRSLKIGDFTWIARHKNYKDQEFVLPYIVERKRMDDLAASIKDGRFHEQKFRLRRCGIQNVIYLVENYGSNTNLGLPIQCLMQALANIRVVDGFTIHITKSLVFSARFLAILTKRLTVRYKNKKLIGSDKPPEQNVLMTFNYFNKSSAKNKALTVTEAFIKILLQLKGVSVEKAVAITSQYKTPHSLINAYKLCNQKEGELLLANLKYADLSRNVGPSVSKAIYQLFSKTA
ncbi:unnamed protein product [Parnassius mnemosyne]|uniref:Crossover junction endonuclease MUS81 n=1 Tax=Parnassius mnemosyne TaxID=213953 RepID=A0AAV1KSH7_9NEOP